MKSGEALWAGAGLESPNRRYRLDMQEDGNLVLYGPNNSVRWTANVQGLGASVHMQGDGNLVIYRQGGVAIWGADTAPAPGAILRLQDDGNLVIYSPSRGALWVNGAKIARVAALDNGQSLSAGQSLTSPNGSFRAMMQPDGNFVVYGPNNSVRWTANVQGSGATIHMQADGNLVIYRPGGVAIWNAGTAPASGTWLEMQNDGNLVIYRQGGVAIWVNGTRVGGSTAATQAANEARALVVEGTTASARVRALFANSEWSPGPVGEWAGDCPKIPYAAWYFATGGAVRIQKGNAIANYHFYNDRGLIKQGAPPIGAVTFYATTSGNPYGHTALSLGDGTVATTTGFDNQGTANAIRPYGSASSGAYLGYFQPG